MYARNLLKLAFLFCCWAVSVGASAYDWKDGFDLSQRDGDRYTFIVSPLTHHYTYSAEHQYVWLVGAYRERANASVAGAAFFKNSFGQPSVYLYPFGKIVRGLFDQPQLYAKVTAGLLYGYRGQYEDKVPFNHNGFSPGIVPGIGWEHESGHQIQINLLGTSAAMLQFSVPLR